MILLPFARPAHCGVILARGWLRLFLRKPMLPIQTGKKLPQEPVFEHPPLWIHQAVAAKCFLAPKARDERKPPCSPGVNRKGARS